MSNITLDASHTDHSADVSGLSKILKKRKEDTEFRRVNLANAKFHLDNNKKMLSVDNEDLSLRINAYEKMLELINIPKRYADRCKGSFLENTVNHWMSGFYGALITDGEIRSLMDPNYVYVPSYDIFNVVMNAMPEELIVNGYHVNDDYVELVTLAGGEMATEIEDSPVYGGVRFIHSDSWNVFPRFDSYLLRLICTNGMTSPLHNQKFRVSGKSPTEILHNSEELVLKAIDQVPMMLSGFASLQKEKIDNYRSIVRKICQENKLPNKLMNVLLDAAEKPEFKTTISDRQITSMFDVINLITFVASHNSEISDSHREHLLSIAGSAALLHTTRCESCGGNLE